MARNKNKNASDMVQISISLPRELVKKIDEMAVSTYLIVKGAMRSIIERVLSGIGEEINRGAVINAVAVSADSKGKDFNKVELQYSKDAGDITIPTKGVFISTNCVETIRDSIRVDEIEKLNAK